MSTPQQAPQKPPDALDEWRCQGYDHKRNRACTHMLALYTGYGMLIQCKCPKCGTINNLGGPAVPRTVKEEPQDGQRVPG